jgi:hypothetical protein
MQESKELAMQFEKELKALLKKWNTEIEMEEIIRGYQGCEYSMKVYILCCMGEAEQLPQDKFCKVCNLPTDGKKCYSKRCPM